MERLIVLTYEDGVAVVTAVEAESKAKFLEDLLVEYERVLIALDEHLPMPGSAISVSTIQKSFAYDHIIRFNDYHQIVKGVRTPVRMEVYTIDEFFASEYHFNEKIKKYAAA